MWNKTFSLTQLQMFLLFLYIHMFLQNSTRGARNPHMNQFSGWNIDFLKTDWTNFRNLLPRIACCVEKVELSLDIEENATIEEITWKSIHLIRKRVSEIVKRRPNDHIFLAGWGVSCLLNQRVKQFPDVRLMIWIFCR